MDVEKIQKINSLALELMKQGLAPDRESAINQAEKVYENQDGSEEYTQMRETMGKVNEAHKEYDAFPRESGGGAQDSSEDLAPARVKEILEQNTKYIVGKLKVFEEKVDQLERELETLKTKMNYQKLPTVKEIAAANVPEPKQEMKVEGAVEESQGEKKESHPRSGNYNDDDVSIERFFYMGSK